MSVSCFYRQAAFVRASLYAASADPTLSAISLSVSILLSLQKRVYVFQCEPCRIYPVHLHPVLRVNVSLAAAVRCDVGMSARTRGRVSRCCSWCWHGVSGCLSSENTCSRYLFVPTLSRLSMG